MLFCFVRSRAGNWTWLLLFFKIWGGPFGLPLLPPKFDGLVVLLDQLLHALVVCALALAQV
jgi:hypothetical protein